MSGSEQRLSQHIPADRLEKVLKQYRSLFKKQKIKNYGFVIEESAEIVTFGERIETFRQLRNRRRAEEKHKKYLERSGVDVDKLIHVRSYRIEIFYETP